MMNFRVIKDSIIDNVLGPNSTGKFVVVGFQRQNKNAVETLDTSRTVQVFYFSSDFPKNKGRLNGPTQNNVTYKIELTVSSAAKGDLSVVNNPASTPAQIAVALSAFQEASYLADNSFDELVDEVYQILMSGIFLDLGLDKGTVSDRWIGNVQKDHPEPRGGYVTITGSMNLTCNTAEQVPGDVGVAGTVFDTTIDIKDDDVEKTGVTVDHT
jgi:hypothetical protein